MKKFISNLEDLLTVAVIAAVAAAFIFLTLGCTTQSQHRFEPTKKINVAEEQRKSIVPGQDAPYSGQDCLKQIEWQIEYCRVTGSCSRMQARRLLRAQRRLDKGYRSQCLYSNGHIREFYRHMQRGSRGSRSGGGL